MKRFLNVLSCFLLILCFVTSCGEIDPSVGETITELLTGSETNIIKGSAFLAGEENSLNIQIKVEETDGLQPAGEVFYTSTKADGSYEINDVKKGTYTVYAQTKDGRSAVIRNVFVKSGNTTVSPFYPVYSSTVKGKITTDGAETGNGGYTVFLLGSVFKAVTDDSGNFEITGVPAGKVYQLLVKKGGYTAVVSANVKVVSTEGTTVPVFNISSEDLNTEGSLLWQGVTEVFKGEPQENYAYLNSTTGKAMVFRNNSWEVLSEAEEDSTTLIWLGSLDKAPEYPLNLYAYYNNQTGSSYIYDGCNWVLLCKAGENGAAGKYLTLCSVQPSNPKVLDTYFNSTDNTTYLYTGSSWAVVAKQLNHEHTFSSEWSYNETQHWHAATCGHDYAASAVADHSFETSITPASCRQEGSITYTCAECSYSYTETIPVNEEHVFELVSQREPSCTEDGELVYRCTSCNAEKRSVIIATGHSWGTDSVCDKCGLVKEDHVHNYSQTVTEPTCMDFGYTTYTCACGDTYKDDLIEPVSHKYNEGVVVKPKTCTEDGLIKYTCERCHASYTETLPAGHEYVHTVLIPASCTENGMEVRVCKLCNDRIEEPLSASHSWGELTVVTEPDCTHDGEYFHECTVCGAKQNVTVEATGHEYKEGICTKCGHKFIDDVQADIDYPQYGMYFRFNEIRSAYGPKTINSYGVYLDHNSDAKINKVAVYLTQSGNLWRRSLAFTGSNITRAYFVPFVSYNADIYYTGLNSSRINTFPLTKNSDGIYTYGTYTTIGANLEDYKGKLLLELSYVGQAGAKTRIFDNLPEMIAWLKEGEHVHNWGEWQTVKESSCTEPGTKERFCTLCSEKQTESIAATGHSFATEWTTDEIYHWHAATCEHKDEMSDKAEHSYANGKCSVCGYTEPEPKPDMLSGVFTVVDSDKGTTRQIRFSKGALYWDGKSFNMEENQYDFRTWSGRKSVINGTETTNGTPTGHTGLFYWSKDKEKTYALNYDGTGRTEADKFALANGGAIAGWDVLRIAEWDYLITRKDSNNNYKHGLVTITTGQGASVHGLVLLPDSWTLPSGCTWTAGYESGWTTNQYNATQWASMEQAGAVFLPAAGGRCGSSVKGVGYNGYWWSSTGSNYSCACNLNFGSGNVKVYYTGDRNSGRGVRLVATVNEVDPHLHTYSSDWTTDGTYHWHAATCEHTDEVSDKAEHSFANGKCSVCGYVQPQTEPEPKQDMLSGVFTVVDSNKGTTRQIRFSKGALYWDGSSFKMEENQYDFRTWYNAQSVINGVYKENDKDIADGETGLFYWSKDKEKTYALNYDSTGRTTTDKFALASGGAIEGWDVLSKYEWNYLTGYYSNVEHRPDASSKYGLATITTEQGASVKGLVLLPDSWTMPDGCDWTAGYGSGWNINKYNATQWASMEQAGAVFLPAAGIRYGSSVYYVGFNGFWWSSSPYSSDSNYAYYLYFYSGDVGLDDDYRRLYGQGVRLVAVVNEVGPHVHTYSSEWTTDETYHWHAATCGHTDEVSGKAEHSFGAWVVTTEATCTTGGVRERACTVCGYKETETVSATGHSFATDWTTDETHHWHAATCEHTDEVSDKAEHTFANGKCSVCGYVQPQTEPDPKPDMLSGVFTVVDFEKGTTRQIRFSKGALYWDGSSFKLENNQYDFRTWYDAPSVINGVYKEKDTDITEGETGLFYWSKDKEKTYALNYYITGSTTADKFALANGGAIAGWDVLSEEEWTYLLERTDNDDNYKYGLATITTGQEARVKGFVLLPDSWILPDGCDWAAGFGSRWTTNNYNAEQWAKMEQAGAVFLPAAGYRNGSSVYSVGGGSFWWSSTPISIFSYYAYNLYVDSGEVYVDYDSRYDGQGVRLVATVNEVGSHVHTYSSEWTTDETYHWHVATCGHTYEVSDKAEHSFANGECNVCGYTEPEPKPDMLPGVFTVKDQTKGTIRQIRFSKGALYWDGSSFKMENNQYDYRTWGGDKSVINGVETTNGTPSGHTGLFYWSKDLEKTYALNYYGTGRTNTDKFALAEGGAIEGWDVLSNDEWIYLIRRRDNSDNFKYGLATITTGQGASVEGLVLLPDNWTLPSGCTWTAEYGKGWTINKYNSIQWASMEQAGAVFLPAAGYRCYGSLVSFVGVSGLWWSSTPDSSGSAYAYRLGFGSRNANVDNLYRDYGFGVRLVAPVKN